MNCVETTLVTHSTPIDTMLDYEYNSVKTRLALYEVDRKGKNMAGVFKLDKEDFVQWLIRKTTLSQRARSDVASRCRRVEKLFNIRLDDAVKSEAGFEKICLKLEKEKSSYVKKGMSEEVIKYVAKGSLVRAVRLYHQFLNSH